MSSNKISAQAEVPPRVYKDVAYSTIYPIKTLAGIPVTRSLHPETQAGRKEFRETFHSNFWNRPGAEYDSLTKDQLAGKKALVIAVQYTTLWNWLPGTFVDALKVTNMLQTQYGYHPKCIRVLADQFNVHNSADKPRWPTKDVIVSLVDQERRYDDWNNHIRQMEGLRWLGGDCSDDSGCQRFLYFSGLGYHLGSGSVANGIIPIDYRKLPGFDGSASYIDPKTVISGQDLNNCLVDSLCGKRVKLTVVLDCYFGKGYCPPDFQPELLGFTRIRGRNLFQSRLAGLGETGTGMEDLPIVGNLLSCPIPPPRLSLF
ncbi:hypothetical protein FRC12_002113 [Ceratobasidium sp. 428]|nr:hypothetical protein FRC12_002113 [Ceratobasidium sp. 428]